LAAIKTPDTCALLSLIFSHISEGQRTNSKRTIDSRVHLTERAISPKPHDELTNHGFSAIGIRTNI